MDSKQLYIASNHLSVKIEWRSRWIHFGTGDEINYERLKSEILISLNSVESLVLITTRSASKRIGSNQIIELLKDLAGIVDFQLWDKAMTKSIRFKSIGVYNQSKHIDSR